MQHYHYFLFSIESFRNFLGDKNQIVTGSSACPETGLLLYQEMV